MDLSNNKTDFSNLLSSIDVNVLVERITQQNSDLAKTSTKSECSDSNKCLKEWKRQWQKLSSINLEYGRQAVEATDSERAATDWLISLFNTLFSEQQVVLVRSNSEPEYFPIQGNQPARIEFAHGFFASALHEIHTSPYRLTC